MPDEQTPDPVVDGGSDVDHDFEVLGSEEVFSSRFTRIRVDRVRMPGGTVGQREIAEHLSAVGVVPLTDDGQVILLRQYRHAFGTRFLEIPAGILDVDGEDPADAARRELVEEVAMDASTLAHLLTFTNSAGWTTERTSVYLATGLTAVPRPSDFALEHEEADMDVLSIPLGEALELVRTGGIVDAKTVVGLLALADRAPDPG